jgi:hypothetical protein
VAGAVQESGTCHERCRCAHRVTSPCGAGCGEMGVITPSWLHRRTHSCRLFRSTCLRQMGEGGYSATFSLGAAWERATTTAWVRSGTPIDGLWRGSVCRIAIRSCRKSAFATGGFVVIRRRKRRRTHRVKASDRDCRSRRGSGSGRRTVTSAGVAGAARRRGHDPASSQPHPPPTTARTGPP